MLYCLDANVFITPANLYYPMDYCPAYWDMIEKYIEEGSVFIHDQVYQELTKGEGLIVDWVKEHNGDSFVKALYDEETQKEYKKIIDFVNADGYTPEVVAEFLSGADPWIIAVCKAHNFVLVTKETYSESSKKKVKIPNICKEFNVTYIDDFEMIRRLGSNFVLEDN